MLVIITATIVYFLFSKNAPFVRTKKNTFERLTTTLQLDERSILYEIGSGDASFLKYAITRTPGAHGVGIEVHPVLTILAKFTTIFKPIRIFRNNYNEVSFAPATHLYMYMLPSMLPDIYAKAQKECKRGTIFLSLDFEVFGVVPDDTISLTANPRQVFSTVAYLYRL